MRVGPVHNNKLCLIQFDRSNRSPSISDSARHSAGLRGGYTETDSKAGPTQLAGANLIFKLTEIGDNLILTNFLAVSAVSILTRNNGTEPKICAMGNQKLSQGNTLAAVSSRLHLATARILGPGLFGTGMVAVTDLQ